MVQTVIVNGPLRRGQLTPPVQKTGTTSGNPPARALGSSPYVPGRAAGGLNAPGCCKQRATSGLRSRKLPVAYRRPYRSGTPPFVAQGEPQVGTVPIKSSTTLFRKMVAVNEHQPPIRFLDFSQNRSKESSGSASRAVEIASQVTRRLSGRASAGSCRRQLHTGIEGAAHSMPPAVFSTPTAMDNRAASLPIRRIAYSHAQYAKSGCYEACTVRGELTFETQRPHRQAQCRFSSLSSQLAANRHLAILRSVQGQKRR